MKIAYLMSIFGNVTQANYFIKQALCDESSHVFIHIDAKSTSIEKDILSHNRITILPEHIDVSWGEYSQIRAYNYMFHFAYQYADFDYFSLNSGNDLFIRPVSEYVQYLEETRFFAYYNCEPLPKSYWQFRGGYGRIALHWPKCVLRRLSDRHPLRYLRTIYGMLYHYHIIPGHKLPKEIQFMGGNDWFTISKACTQEMLEYIDSHPKWTELFTHSYIGTEIYYVTLFEMLKANRPVESKNNLRFVDWKARGQRRNAGSPNILTMECLPEILSSKRFFGRKFDYTFDHEVVDFIIENTLNQKCRD